MQDGTNPFDDPEFQEEMRHRGVVHKPGMAKDLMQELAPLLRAEGIDFDDPNAEFDIDQLNAAMATAVAQHNLHLSTPIDAERKRTLDTLRSVATAVAEDRFADAAGILESLPPNPTPDQPSAGHVLGAGAGLLDNWFTDPSLLPSLHGTRIRKWKGGPQRAIATDLLALAQKSRAFDSQATLIARHGGLLVSKGLALALGSSLATFVERESTGFTAAVDRMFDDQGSRAATSLQDFPAASTPSTGVAFGIHRPFTPFPSEILEAFEESLTLGTQASDALRREALAELAHFKQLLGLAARAEIDLNDPEDINPFLDLIFRIDEDVDKQQIIQVMLEYTHFRKKFDRFGGSWDEAYDLIHEAAEDLDPVPVELYDAIDAAYDLPERAQREAFRQTTIVNGVDQLLSWLSDSRMIAPSGLPRRDDIETAAEFIGISAKGVAKLPPYSEGLTALPLWRDELSEGQKPRLVRAAGEIPELAAWWNALGYAGLIERKSTRVVPGRNVDRWREGGELYLDIVVDLITVFIAEILTQDFAKDRYGFAAPTAINTMRLLMDAVVLGESTASSSEGTTRFAVESKLRQLEHARIIEPVEDGFVIPPPLRAPAGQAIIMTMDFLAKDLVQPE